MRVPAHRPRFPAGRPGPLPASVAKTAAEKSAAAPASYPLLGVGPRHGGGAAAAHPPLLSVNSDGILGVAGVFSPTPRVPAGARVRPRMDANGLQAAAPQAELEEFGGKEELGWFDLTLVVESSVDSTLDSAQLPPFYTFLSVVTTGPQLRPGGRARRRPRRPPPPAWDVAS